MKMLDALQEEELNEPDPLGALASRQAAFLLTLLDKLNELSEKPTRKNER